MNRIRQQRSHRLKPAVGRRYLETVVALCSRRGSELTMNHLLRLLDRAISDHASAGEIRRLANEILHRIDADPELAATDFEGLGETLLRQILIAGMRDVLTRMPRGQQCEQSQFLFSD